jgi:hypothetical protein
MLFTGHAVLIIFYQTLAMIVLCNIPYKYNRLLKSGDEKKQDAKKKSDKLFKEINIKSRPRAESANFEEGRGAFFSDY